MTEEKPYVVLTEADIQYCINRCKDVNYMIYDVETSGLNPRRNHIVAYVITVGPRPEDTFYVPVRHKQGGNCLDWKGLETGEEETVLIHPFEIEFAKVTNRPELTVVGHNLLFDLLFSAYKGIFFGGRTECTQVAAALINELQYSFSLDACAKQMHVTEKKGDELYFHMAKLFGGEPDRKQMANYWKLSGTEPIAVDYACGDGVSTWELREAQQKELEAQELIKVWNVECRVTKTLFRMQFNRMRIDVEALDQLRDSVPKLIEEARTSLPAGINVNSAKQLQSWFNMQGVTDYPTTEKGNPSFNAEYLETNEMGRLVMDVRKLTTLMDRFITPLYEKHLIKGYIMPLYNQLRGDDFGVVTGRLSCNDPNIQQVYKRDKKMGKLFRKIFIPEDGYTWSSKDYKSCEPRIYAGYSGCKLLIDGYAANPPVDFYQSLSLITGIPRSPTAGIAGNCKQLALSIFYGAGIPRTALMLGIPVERAREIRQMVNDMCPEIQEFAKEAQRRAQSRGYVKSVLGRRIRYSGREFTYKAGGNVVAAGNADLIKLALVEVDDYLQSMGQPPPIATVHDSIELQFPEGRTDIDTECTKIMEHCADCELIKFDVRQEVECGTGRNWAESTYGAENAV